MIQILVDSASDCKSKADGFDRLIPITVIIDGKEYADGVTLHSDTFYQLLAQTGEFPKTSQPSPQDFLEYFEAAKRSGDQLIYFALSSQLSGTYQGATIAKSMVDYNDIYIIDTKGATHMIGLLVQHAATMVKAGKSAKEIVEACEALKGRVRIFAGLDTLEYLYKGGRLSCASAAVGSLAGIKPVITITREGKVEALGKCLGRARTMQDILRRMASDPPDETFPLYSLYTLGEKNCELLEEKMQSAGYNITKRRQIGPTIGTHVGPEAYGVVYIAKA